MEKLSLLVFGAGAIGTYVGGSLALAGHRVVFLEQPATVAELKERGLLLDLGADRTRRAGQAPGSAIFRPKPAGLASSLPEALAAGPFDAAIFALKSFDTAAFLAGLGPHLEALPPVLCLSNGVENEAELAAVLGPERVIAGTVTSSIGRRAAGEIVLERLRGLGLVSSHPLSMRLFAALAQARLNPGYYARAGDMKWSKMLTNLPANATAAILDRSAAQVFAHPGLFRLEMEMLREALAVMKANGNQVVDLPGVPVRALALATRLPEWLARPLLQRSIGGGRGGKMPSFHIDLHSGRGKSEVAWLNGAVVRYGSQAGLATPVNQTLTETLLALTRGEKPLSDFSGQAEKLLALALPG